MTRRPTMGSSDTGHIHTSNLARKSTVPVHRLVIQRTNRLESTRELALRAGFPEFAVAPHTVAWGYLPKRGKLVKSSFSFRFETCVSSSFKGQYDTFALRDCIFSFSRRLIQLCNRLTAYEMHKAAGNRCCSPTFQGISIDESFRCNKPF